MECMLPLMFPTLRVLSTSRRGKSHNTMMLRAIKINCTVSSVVLGLKYYRSSKSSFNTIYRCLSTAVDVSLASEEQSSDKEVADNVNGEGRKKVKKVYAMSSMTKEEKDAIRKERLIKRLLKRDKLLMEGKDGSEGGGKNRKEEEYHDSDEEDADDVEWRELSSSTTKKASSTKKGKVGKEKGKAKAGGKAATENERVESRSKATTAVHNDEDSGLEEEQFNDVHLDDDAHEDDGNEITIDLPKITEKLTPEQLSREQREEARLERKALKKETKQTKYKKDFEVVKHFRIAIIGRPNVGKSTLFNRIAGKREAIVSEIAGTTRDRRETKCRWSSLEFTLIDTGGLEDEPQTAIDAAIKEQTIAAVQTADVVLFVVDARAGITREDEIIAEWARKQLTSSKIIVLANKVESLVAKGDMEHEFPAFEAEAYALGFGAPVPVSAEHGLGMSDLHSCLQPFGIISKEAAEEQMKHAGLDPDRHLVDVSVEDLPRGYEEMSRAELDEKDKEPLQLAIVGRPNVGKSTLLNRLVDDERVITGATPGLTRDSISVSWNWNGRTVHLVDTAGIRRAGKRDSSNALEYLSVHSSKKAIMRAHVVVLVMDGKEHLTQQDLSIAHYALEEGRALVLCINKADVMLNTDVAITQLRDWCKTRIPQVGNVPVVCVSALTGLNCELLIPAALHSFDNWRTRISTSLLNDWLEMVYKRHPPPRHKGKAMKFRYITQSNSRPPTFVLFSSRANMPDSYKRFLTNSLREEFNLHGVPLRVHTRSRENPYDPNRKYDPKPAEIEKKKNTPEARAKAAKWKADKLRKTQKYMSKRG